MTEVHSCSYYCDRPECIKAQRDELRDRLGSMTDREIMQRALEALYNMVEDGDITDKQQAMATITALRERLAQPEQEPLQFKCTIVDDAHPNGVPLEQWVKPPQRKPLTDEEIARACVPLGWAILSFTEVARAIEAAHGIKGQA